MRPPAAFEIRSTDNVDPRTLRERVAEVWHGEAVVAHGEEIRPAELPGFVALADGRIIGHVSYRVANDRCEVTSIEADPPRAGIGTALLDAALEAARRAGCRTAWLTTTNDNLDALRFYQRRGFRLSELRAGAVDRARLSLKPEIPVEGSYDIPMRDELDLEREL